jgi:hypothetical protein
MTVEEKRLRMLANYLKESESNVDSYHDGQLESAIKYAKQEVKNEIGDYLEEILNIPEKEILEEIKRTHGK